MPTRRSGMNGRASTLTASWDISEVGTMPAFLRFQSLEEAFGVPLVSTLNIVVHQDGSVVRFPELIPATYAKQTNGSMHFM